MIMDEISTWEEKCAAVRLSSKMWKLNKISFRSFQVHKWFDQDDQEADEWRARKMAKDISKAGAGIDCVEKLQDLLHSIGIQRL
ncbi:hypothetical protein CsatB_015487 [Cannabis sativa]